VGHPHARIPVFSQIINFGGLVLPSVGATPFTVGTPIQLNIPGHTVMEWEIVDTSGQTFQFSLGATGSQVPCFVSPQGGGSFKCLISQNAYIWLTALTPTNNTGTTVTLGLMVINGYQ
jgi:hypothetical protein